MNTTHLSGSLSGQSAPLPKTNIATGIASKDLRIASAAGRAPSSDMGSSPSTISPRSITSTPPTTPLKPTHESHISNFSHQSQHRSAPFASDNEANKQVNGVRTNGSGPPISSTTTPSSRGSAVGATNGGSQAQRQQQSATPNGRPPQSQSQPQPQPQQRPAALATHTPHSGLKQKHQQRQSQTQNSLSSHSNPMQMQQQQQQKPYSQQQQQQPKSQAQQTPPPASSPIILNMRQSTGAQFDLTQPFRASDLKAASGINPALYSNLTRPRTMTMTTPTANQVLSAVGLQAASEINKTSIAPSIDSENKKITSDIKTAQSQTVKPDRTPKTGPAKESPAIAKKSTTKTPKVQSSGAGWWYPDSKPFDWDIYLKARPAEVAPKQAFNQSLQPLENKFLPGMKLEAEDPRSNSWSLASVIYREGLRIRLRLDGSDNMNDFFEVIDSHRIRPVGAKPTEILCAPIGFKQNLAKYPSFVEKILSDQDVTIAPPECFYPRPKQPPRNLFQRGMKLEAVDKKNAYFVCPATVADVRGADIDIGIDGGKGYTRTYTCKYYSRDIFPINWCRDTGHKITPPIGWDDIVELKTDQPSKPTKSPTIKTQISSPIVKERSSSATKNSVSRILNKPHKQQKSSASSIRANQSSQVKSQKSCAEKKSDLSSAKSPSVELHPKKELTPDVVPSPPTSVDDNLPEPLGEDKFQCQRTIPYDQWRLNKLTQAKSVSQATDTPVPAPISKQVPKKDLESSYTNEEKSNENPTQSDHNVSVATSYEGSILNSSSSSTTEICSSSNEAEFFASEAISSPTRKKMKTTPPEDQVSDKLQSSNALKPYSEWTVKDILDLIKKDEGLNKYSQVFENHEIDGKAFVLLSTDVMINHMGLKIGPVLKINALIDKLKHTKS